MYVGRIVSAGKTNDGNFALMYRISSRSFPNRKVHVTDGKAAIVPVEGSESDLLKSQFISYNCVQLSNRHAVVTNGSHTDLIFDKLKSGISIRDSLISVLSGMDYEHDQLNTPRIALVFNIETKDVFFGTIREDGIWVQKVNLKNGQAFYLATYEQQFFSGRCFDEGFDVSDENEACDYILYKGVFADLEKPILSVAVYIRGNQVSQIGYKRV